MFLENIEEADINSEKLENHFEEVSDSLLDIQNEVDFQRLLLVWVGYFIKSQNLRDCKRISKWPSMDRWQWLIHNSTLETFI